MKGAPGTQFRRIWRFIVSDVWDIELSSLSAIRALGVKAVRVLHLVFKGFREDECPLHASALTFNTLMAIVPILALSLALARVFGGAELAETKLRDAVSEFTGQFNGRTVITNVMPDTASLTETPGDVVLTRSDLAEKLNSMLDSGFKQVEEINFAALGSLGFILVIWMVVAVLGRVEASFNRVWGVSVDRPMFRKFADYLFVVIVLPFLITMASSLKIAELVSKFLDESSAIRLRAFLDSGSLKTATVLLITILTFTFITKFMPNTKVRLAPALAGGVVAALLFIFWLKFCSAMQVGVARYSKFYGSFAVVPIVLAWVYVSWEIVLFGAEVAFAVQNCTTYNMEQGARMANIRSRMILALSVIVEAGKAMLGKAKDFETSAYASERRVPVRFLNDIVDELVKEGLLAELSESEGGHFVLLKSPGSLRVKEITDAVMHSGVKPEALGLGSVEPKIEKVVEMAGGGGDESLKEMSVEDLIGMTDH